MSGPPDEFRARVFEALMKTGKTTAFGAVTSELVHEVMHEMKWWYWKELTYFTRVNDHQIQCVLCGHILERWAPYDPMKSSTFHEKIHYDQVRWILHGEQRAHALMQEPTWEFTDFPQAIVDRRNA